MKTFTFLIFLFFSLVVSGQSPSDTISMLRQHGTTKYYHQNKEVDFLRLPDIMQDNPEALKAIKNAKIARGWGSMLLGFGGINLAFGVLNGLSMAVEEDDATYLATGTIVGIVAGGIFIAISIPINRNYRRGTQRAIDIYNSGLQQSSRKRTNLQLGFNSNGFGLALKF